jgi:AcrR family transcriptional regulator
MVSLERPVQAERRAFFVQCAKDVFAERGFECTTMDDIARAAGFTKPILYQFFPSKADLYHEIVTTTGARLLKALSDAVRADELPRARVRRALAAYFSMVVEDPSAFRILFTHGHSGTAANDLQVIERRLVEFLVPFIDESREPDERRDLAAGVVGLAEGLAISWLRRQARRGWPTPDPFESQRLAERATLLAWGGLHVLRPTHD